MFHLTVFSILILTAHAGNLPTVLTPFTLSPSVEILKTPVTKVETLSIAPTITKAITPAVAFTSPVIQKIDSYSVGDSSNAEIRHLLRSLLSELRGGKTVTTLSTPLASYSAPAVLDSYAAPPRNTVTDYNAPTYPDSIDSSRRQKPEKVVLVQEKQVAPIVTSAAIVEQPVAVKEVVKTVYQPVYVPVQYAAQPEYLTYAQPVAQSVPVAVPTTVKTGASAVAISTIHQSPAYAIQQQQYIQQPVQYVQQVQPVAAVASASAGTAILDASAAAIAYKK